MSIQSYDPSALRGRPVYAADGEQIGTVKDVLEDDRGAAQYLEVTTGWGNGSRHAVPVHDLTESGDGVTVPFTRSQLEQAPTFQDGELVDYAGEQRLGGHYGHSVREWDETRDAWLSGEDLSRGPTPETRHPAGHVEGRDDAERDSVAGETGGVDDVADTTQGPTPTIRQTMRATDDDRAAAGQPGSDPGTRADVGGNQDVGERPARGAGSVSDPAYGDEYDGTDAERRVRLRRSPGDGR
jgi:sporulation protein YlmC with PRC-barrel domain